jgi:hypothetical protein
MSLHKRVGITLNVDAPMSYSKYSVHPMAHPPPLCDPEHTVIGSIGSRQ